MSNLILINIFYLKQDICMYIALFIVLNKLIQYFTENGKSYFSVFKYNDFYFIHAPSHLIYFYFNPFQPLKFCLYPPIFSLVPNVLAPNVLARLRTRLAASVARVRL